MSKVFISGFVGDVRGGLIGVAVRATITGKKEEAHVWEGVTDTDGAFGFEVRLSDRAHGRLVIEALPDKRGARVALTLDSLVPAGAHVLLTIPSEPPDGGEPPRLP